MKGIIILILFLNSALSIAQQAEFKFYDKTIRLGKVTEGEIVSTIFLFKNVGDSPLIISDYKVACTCTVVLFPKEPILPGKEAGIEVSFDSAEKMGYQDRSIEIYSNAKKSPEKIRFTVTVNNVE